LIATCARANCHISASHGLPLHSLTKINLAILDWFGPRYELRFTDLDKPLGQIDCAACRAC
jgi:hypothetical protein